LGVGGIMDEEVVAVAFRLCSSCGCGADSTDVVVEDAVVVVVVVAVVVVVVAAVVVVVVVVLASLFLVAGRSPNSPPYMIVKKNEFVKLSSV
jgi:hypothetical protein